MSEREVTDLRLSARERQVLELRHGLKDGEMRTVEEVATAMDVSPGRVRHVERGAVATLLAPAPALPPPGLLVREAATPLNINGMRAVDFIRRAYDLGTDLNGPGRYEMGDPIQSELRRIKDWITMAEHDALGDRLMSPRFRASSPFKDVA